jgi:phosphocarrier protein HPr
MLMRRVTVGSSVGLHARPAAVFCAAVGKQSAPITIEKDGGQAVEARSIIRVLSLHIRGGDTVILRTEDDDAAESLEELASLVASELDAVS